MKKIAVLVSGGGSNLQSIIDSVESGALKVQIVLVLSNKEGVYGLESGQAWRFPGQGDIRVETHRGDRRTWG